MIINHKKFLELLPSLHEICKITGELQVKHHKTHIVLAENLVPSKLEGDEPEDLEVIKCKKNDINKLLFENNNIDSRVLASLYVYSQVINDNKS